MNSTLHFIEGLVVMLILAGFGGWVLFRSLKRNDDPARLLFKWLLTAGLGVVFCRVVVPIVTKGGAYEASFVGVPAAAVCGLVFCVIWRHNIGSIFSKPFTSLYDGGDLEEEPRPYYSIAEAKRKKGQYTEAVAEIRKQLEKFPTDAAGQLMLAEIQAANLNDLPGAELTIQRLCNQPSQAPHSVTMALFSMADWRLQYAQDTEAARQDLQKVIDLFPETELAHAAAQRIAHLAQPQYLLQSHDRRAMPLPAGVRNIGLLKSSSHLQPSETDPSRQAAEYVAHLQKHPLDGEARENLAILYADHFKRLDMAADQLDQLVGQPNAPAKQIAHWLNLLADLQVRHGADYETARATLERIIQRMPNHSAATLAQNRIELLKLELKGIKKGQSVALGSYEQDVGLRRDRPERH